MDLERGPYGPLSYPHHVVNLTWEVPGEEEQEE